MLSNRATPHRGFRASTKTTTMSNANSSQFQDENAHSHRKQLSTITKTPTSKMKKRRALGDISNKKQHQQQSLQQQQSGLKLKLKAHNNNNSRTPAPSKRVVSFQDATPKRRHHTGAILPSRGGTNFTPKQSRTPKQFTPHPKRVELLPKGTTEEANAISAPVSASTGVQLRKKSEVDDVELSLGRSFRQQIENGDDDDDDSTTVSIEGLNSFWDDVGHINDWVKDRQIELDRKRAEEDRAELEALVHSTIQTERDTMWKAWENEDFDDQWKAASNVSHQHEEDLEEAWNRLTSYDISF